jgi:hypothetical protein
MTLISILIKKGGKGSRIQWPDGESGNQNINNNNKNDDIKSYFKKNSD